VLGAANADLPWPSGDDPLETLWHAATILREHRGDGHVAALLVAGLDGVESLVWRAALEDEKNRTTEQTGKGLLQPVRGWTDEEWLAASYRLSTRGWLTADGAANDVARRRYTEIEETTDQLARGPWQQLGDAATRRCAELLTPIARRAATYLPQPNPIGLAAVGES
jgi:hypothetical protein